MNDAELVNRQVDRGIVGTRVDRNVPFGCEHDREARVIRGGGRGESRKDGLASEDGDAIDRGDKSPNVFASDIADVRCRGPGAMAER